MKWRSNLDTRQLPRTGESPSIMGYLGKMPELNLPPAVKELAPAVAPAELAAEDTFIDRAVERARAAGLEPDIPAMRLVLAMHRATNLVIYDLESSVHRPSGWAWSSFQLLFALWMDGPVDSKTAARLAGMSRAAVSSLANTLERDGLVVRLPNKEDGRSVLLDLTRAGERRILKVFPEHNRREAKWAKCLDPEERAELTRLLDKVARLSSEPWVSVRS